MNDASESFYPRALPQRPRSFRHRVGADVIPLRSFRNGALARGRARLHSRRDRRLDLIAAMLAIGMPSGQDICVLCSGLAVVVSGAPR